MNRSVFMFLVISSMMTMTMQVKACWLSPDELVEISDNVKALMSGQKNYSSEIWFNEHIDEVPSVKQDREIIKMTQNLLIEIKNLRISHQK